MEDLEQLFKELEEVLDQLLDEDNQFFITAIELAPQLDGEDIKEKLIELNTNFQIVKHANSNNH